VKHEREEVAGLNKVIELRVKSCCKCHTELMAEEGKLIQINQTTDLTAAKAQVIEVRQYQTDYQFFSWLLVSDYWSPT
jgi:hypothetical protein